MLDAWVSIRLAVFGLGVVTVASTVIAKRKTKPGEQTVHSSRTEIMPVIRKVIQSSYGHTLWSIAGEANPQFYELLYEQLERGLGVERMNFEMILGPRIAVAAEEYDKYVDSTGRKKERYWEAHPILRLAHQYQGPARDRGAVTLYLRLKGETPPGRHCFCTTNETGPSVTERAHGENDRAPVLVETGTRVGYKHLRREFERAIAADEVVVWAPDSPAAEKTLVFWRFPGSADDAERAGGQS